MTEDLPRRVLVTRARPKVVRRSPGPPAVRALSDQDLVGELLITSLVRAQLGLAIRVAAVYALLLGGLPLLLALVPAARTSKLLGLPLAWSLLGVLVYPLLLVGGWFYVRLADRNERDFIDLVERS